MNVAARLHLAGEMILVKLGPRAWHVGRTQIAAVGLLVGAVSGSLRAAPTSANQGAAYRHIMKARAIAGADLQEDFYHRCFIESEAGPISKLRKVTARIAPAKVFDNLYFVGQNNVSSWALKTNAGILIFDTQNNPGEASEFIEGGLTKLGLDPRQIKYIVIMHEHADHFGGAQYLASKYGAHILASPTAWQNMATYHGRGEQFIPKHDVDVADGQRFSFGGTTLTFYSTPGHTQGTISVIFRTTDNGVPHTIGFFGGMGSPHTNLNRKQIIDSYARWRALTSAAGVDTLIANHQGQDEAADKVEFIRVRHASDSNPFVLGRNTYQRYFGVQSECIRADLARAGGEAPPK